jgi:hypothetical protein
VAYTDVLRHFETSNLLVATRDTRSIAIVETQDAALRIINTRVAKALITPSGLIPAQCNAGDLGTVVNRGVFSKSTPAAAEIKNGVALLKTNLFTDHSKLVILELLKGLLLVYIANDTRGIDHAGTEEPSIKVIATVVVVTDLLLVYQGLDNAEANGARANYPENESEPTSRE